jgi:hypothetical protein
MQPEFELEGQALQYLGHAGSLQYHAHGPKVSVVRIGVAIRQVVEGVNNSAGKSMILGRWCRVAPS